MGIKASATCVLNFDEAKGFLIGEPNKGLNCMFTMMNHARLGTGMQGLCLGEASFQGAIKYANDRLQMRALTDRLIGIDGTVSTRSEGLRKRIDLNQDRQEALTDRIAQVEKRLRAQYTALDKQMGALSGLQGYVTQQINAFNANSNNNN
jgi:alkylation response protein AidB-like acyl-CoA dehydrogenase